MRPFTLVLLFLVACSRAAPEAVVPDAKPGDIVPVVGAPYLTFAGPEPMENWLDETFVFNDRCRAYGGTLKVLAADGKRVLLIYREPHERSHITVSGSEVVSEADRLDCPDRSPIICDPDAWRDIVRAYLSSGGDQAAQREWVRSHLPGDGGSQ